MYLCSIETRVMSCSQFRSPLTSPPGPAAVSQHRAARAPGTALGSPAPHRHRPDPPAQPGAASSLPCATASSGDPHPKQGPFGKRPAWDVAGSWCCLPAGKGTAPSFLCSPVGLRPASRHDCTQTRAWVPLKLPARLLGLRSATASSTASAPICI